MSEERGTKNDQASKDPSETDESRTPVEPVDDLATSTHTVTADGKELTYTATTGRVVLRHEVTEDGVFKGTKPKAEVFVTSYVLDQPDGAEPRPVTFAFNGGPGSSSIWLHLGVLGPRRVDMGDVGELKPPPYGLVDNAETLLAVSDLVFIDPVSTGYSRVAEGEKAEQFHGYSGDMESVADVIRVWTTRNQRWISPKFLIGESYGTLRAAALSEHLQTRYGMYLNGVMLISTVLDMSSIGPWAHEGNECFVNFLPTYAAVAHYHGKHEGRSLREVLDEVEAYCERDYPFALARGHRLSAQERREHAEKIASLTGVDADWVDRANLRLEHTRFFAQLLREERKVVGRLDSRFTGDADEANAERSWHDPSMDAIMGPYAAAFNHMIRAELGYENDLPYEQLTPNVHPWSYKEFEGRPIDVAPKLARAMRQNPHLQVHVAYGYYDGATPYWGAQEVFAQMNLPEHLRDNMEHKYYDAGHMMYVHEPSRVQQCRDLAEFVIKATRG